MNLLKVFAVMAAVFAIADLALGCDEVFFGDVMKECLEDEGIPSQYAGKFQPVNGQFNLGKTEFDAMCAYENRFLSAGACVMGNLFRCKELTATFTPQLKQAAFLMDFTCGDPLVDRECLAVALLQNANEVFACAAAKVCNEKRANIECVVESLNKYCTDGGYTAGKFAQMLQVLPPC